MNRSFLPAWALMMLRSILHVFLLVLHDEFTLRYVIPTSHHDNIGQDTAFDT